MSEEGKLMCRVVAVLPPPVRIPAAGLSPKVISYLKREQKKRRGETRIQVARTLCLSLSLGVVLIN